MIQIEQLFKAYGPHEVLKGINLQFERGKVYGIVGENGAGKTTLFKCIAGLERCEGHLACDRMPLKDHLGFLQTDPYFFAKMTGREYARLLCNARSVDPGDLDARNIFELPLDEYALHYSTGMKKKLALWAVLLQGNDYFILDEPFNGVDIHSNILITGIIHQLKALDKIVIISSHIFATLHDTCDEIHLLQAGRFAPKVLRADFDQLERDMKDFTIGNRIEILGMR